MAIEYYMRAACDKCGREIEPMTKQKGRADIDPQRWEWADKWRDEGVMRGLAPRMRQAKLYCAKCAGS